MTKPFDYRALQTPVRDQDMRSACTGFAVSAAHEWIANASGRSVEDALWAAHSAGGADPGCESVFIEEALSGLEHEQHASEETWPFQSPAWPAKRPTAACDPAVQMKLPLWREITSPGFAAVAAEGSKGHAVLLDIGQVVPAWATAASTGFIDAQPGSKVSGYHSVLAVGVVVTTIAAGDGRPAIVFKNSWGDDWGDAGYGYLSDRYADEHIRYAYVLESEAADG